MKPDDDKIEQVRNSWHESVNKFSEDKKLIEKSFEEIKSSYCAAGRHYHNLQHILSLLSHCDRYSTQLLEVDAVKFAVFYHDIVYNALRSDNEEKSARIAAKRLQDLNVDETIIRRVEKYILATKAHELRNGDDRDLEWFLDFDLSILGTETAVYMEYSRNVRKEFRLYPDLIYKKGRRKFLQQALAKPHIFFTNEFRSKYNNLARANMRAELIELSN